MVKPTVFDCSLIQLPRLGDRMGRITPVENGASFPFRIKRVFYLYELQGGES